ncbi:alpha-1,4-glucan--maltose-1-phosphate maltosyltransferase [Puniceicoccaceae bacterium K14]|nr:alpha-1,4-glucan--maltose-1-phosphate maltosyltransferase [Puniceicoccaceae bacterium K14]
MSSLRNAPGRRRVIVENVRPSLDGGKYPIKRVIGDAISVQAAAFTDSHDRINVSLLHRLTGSSEWVRTPMRSLGNDEYEAEFQPWEIGLYEYAVSGSIDHFGSWLHGFARKAESGAPLEVELLIGGDIILAAAKRATGDEKKHLLKFGKSLKNESKSVNERIEIARDEDLKWLISRIVDAKLEALSPIYPILFERKLAAFSTWYEYFPRSCGPDASTHGTFHEAKNRLYEIDRMGFNIVYFPPIHPIGKSHRKGKNNSLTPSEFDVGSPWAIGGKEGGHKDILSELGTLEDYKSFIQEAASYEIEVAMDIAFQCSPDHPWVEEHPEWFKWRPDGTVQYAENPPKKYQDILPINFETEDWENLWQELKSVFDYWIEVGVKVFRVDNPHTKSLAFWNWCIIEIKKEHPEAIFLAEAFTVPKRKYNLAKGGFTQGYTYFTWRNNPSEMREYVQELTQSEAKEFFWPNFWPNTPDILHEDLQVKNRATYMGRYILAATLSSNTGIYGPAFELMDHEPFPGKEENNNSEKYELKQWDWDKSGNLKDDIARVNAIRNSHPALQRTFNIAFGNSDNPHFICYLKQNFDRTDQLLIIVNMDWTHTQSGYVHLPLDHMGIDHNQSFSVRDLYDPSESEYTWRGHSNFVKLDPKVSPAHIFKIRHL